MHGRLNGHWIGERLVEEKVVRAWSRFDGPPGDRLEGLQGSAARLAKRSDPPKVGEHTRALLAAAGLEASEIDALYAQRVVA